MRKTMLVLAAIAFAITNSATAQDSRCRTVLECAQQAVEAALASKEAHRVAVPSGAVMAFNLAKCPNGWKPYAAAAGRVIVGSGEGNRDMNDKLLTTRRLGEISGSEAHALSIDEIPAHSHDYIFTNHHSTPKHTDYSPHEFGKSNTKKSTTNTGGGQAHNNMPPFVVLLYCERI